MRVRILCSAIEDLARGRRFYDRQAEGLGDYFFDSLFSDVDSLALFGGIHGMRYGFHRLLAKRFPYAIYYRMEAGMVVVFRIIDCREDPARTERKWGESPA